MRQGRLASRDYIVRRCQRREVNQDMTTEAVVKQARETALKQGRHLPTIIVEGKENHVGCVLADFPEDHRGKVLMMFSAGLSVACEEKLGELRQAHLISEGWMSRAKAGKLPAVPPSRDPDRIEALIVAGRNVETGGSTFVSFEMVRNETGKLVDLTEFETSQWARGQASFESPLLDAFIRGYRAGLGRVS
jgi:hypothetical protein